MRYRRGAVDYGLPPIPPLEGERAEWAAQLLAGRTTQNDGSYSGSAGIEA
jgi:hypothetical protein